MTPMSPPIAPQSGSRVIYTIRVLPYSHRPPSRTPVASALTVCGFVVTMLLLAGCTSKLIGVDFAKVADDSCITVPAAYGQTMTIYPLELCGPAGTVFTAPAIRVDGPTSITHLGFHPPSTHPSTRAWVRLSDLRQYGTISPHTRLTPDWSAIIEGTFGVLILFSGLAFVFGLICESTRPATTRSEAGSQNTTETTFGSVYAVDDNSLWASDGKLAVKGDRLLRERTILGTRVGYDRVGSVEPQLFSNDKTLYRETGVFFTSKEKIGEVRCSSFLGRPKEIVDDNGKTISDDIRYSHWRGRYIAYDSAGDEITELDS